MTPYFQQEPKIFARKVNKFIYPYLEVWYNGKRSRLHIGCKVRASQWCAESHRAYISQFHSPIDNFNNENANREIEACIMRYFTFISYLCCNPSKIDNFHAEFQNYMGRPKKQPQQPEQQPEQIDVFKILEKAIDANKELGDKTKKHNYKGKGLRLLRAFEVYRDKPISSFEEFDADFVYELVEFVKTGEYNNNGKPYAMDTINGNIKYAVASIKCAPNNYLSQNQKILIPTPQLGDKTDDNNAIALRDSEVIKLWNYRTSNKRDEEIRDMFLLLCLTGQRVGDLPSLEGGVQYVDNIPCLKFIQEKCSHKINVDIVFPLAEEILKKYNKLPITDIEKKINKNLERIAKEAGITGTEILSVHYNGSDKPTETEVERVSLIKSHTGRRTFVSVLKVHGWEYEDIRKYTGQSMKIVALYDKSTSIDKRIFKNSKPEERLMTYDEIRKEPQQVGQINYKPNRFPNSEQEAREVLQFLGVETISNDIGELLGFIMMRESEIIELCKGKIDILLIKDLFNTDLPLESRCKALKVFLDSQK